MTGYDRIAHLYDVDMARNMPFDDMGFYASAVAGFGRVLEMGCGNGRILLELVARGLDAVGVDRSQPMLAQLVRKARERGLYPKVARMDVRRLGFADTQFGAVLCPYSLVTYMVGDADAPDLVREARRLLRPGGRFIIDAFVPRTMVFGDEFVVDYVREFDGGKLKRSKRVRELRSGINRVERRYEVEPDDGSKAEIIETVEDVRPFAPAQLRALLEEAGLVAVFEAWDYRHDNPAANAQFFAIVARAPRRRGA